MAVVDDDDDGGGWEAPDGVGVGVGAEAEAAGDGTEADEGAVCCEMFVCAVPPGMGPRR